MSYRSFVSAQIDVFYLFIPQHTHDCKYLGLFKSSGGGSVFYHKSILKKYFFYQSIERPSLHFPTLFDQYPNKMKVIKFP